MTIINDHWEDFASVAITDEDPPYLRESLRMAFYLGADCACGVRGEIDSAPFSAKRKAKQVKLLRYEVNTFLKNALSNPIGDKE